MKSIAYTGFIVSLVSYVVFWGADIARTGFVSRYFSVHVFLLAALVFGGWMMFVEVNDSITQ